MGEQEGVVYRLEVVGGPFDGARGLVWFDDGEHPCPEEIWVGTCPGNGSCGMECRRGRRHPSYWTDVESIETPMKAVRYEKEDDWVRRVEFAGGDEFAGVARYVMGGLEWLPVRRAEEMVPAGAAGG